MFGVKNTTFRPNLYIQYLQVAYTLDEKGNAFAFLRHYYGSVGLLHEKFGKNKGDARVPLDFPFFLTTNPDRPLDWELVNSSFKVIVCCRGIFIPLFLFMFFNNNRR